MNFARTARIVLLAIALCFGTICAAEAQHHEELPATKTSVQSSELDSKSSEESNVPLLIGHQAEAADQSLTASPNVQTQHNDVTDVIVLVDSTVSMAWPVGRERRISIAQWCVLDIADGLPEDLPAAFVSLADEASALRQLLPISTSDRSQLRRTVMRLNPKGDGKIDKLLSEAKRLLASKPNAIPLIILVTDGVDCDPFSHGVPIRDLYSQFKNRLHFQVLGIGDNHVISAKLRDLANQGGVNGEFSSVKSYAELPTALSNIRSLFDAIRRDRREHARLQIAQLESCRKNLTRTDTLLANRIREVGILRERIEDLEKVNHDQSIQITDLSTRNKSLTKQTAELTQRVEKLDTANSTLTRDNKRLAAENSRLAEESAARLRDTERLTEERHVVELSRDGYRRAYLTWLVLALSFLALLVVASLLWWFRVIRLTDRLGHTGTERDQIREQYHKLSAKLDEINVHLRHLEKQLADSEDEGDDAKQELEHARSDIDELKQEVHRLEHELKDCCEDKHCLVHKLDDARDLNDQHTKEIARLTDDVQQLTERVKRLKRKNEALEERAVAAEHDAGSTRQQLSTCREHSGRLEERLSASQRNCDDQELRIRELNQALDQSREESRRFAFKLRRCQEYKENNSRELLRVSTHGAAAESRADQLERALHESQRNVDAIQQAASVSRAEQAAAFADTLSATREMVANGRKNDCCHNGHDHAPVIVAHNTPSHSSASPLGGASPVGGTPGATTSGAAGGGGAAAGVPGCNGQSGGGGAGPLIPTFPGLPGGSEGGGGGLESLLGLAGTAIGTTIGGPFGGVLGGLAGGLGKIFGL